MIYRILILTSLVLMIGCSPREHDKRLTGIDAIIAESPEEALALLDSIDSIARPTFAEADRYYLDFLRIKARDKNYIRHSSDTTILKVIDYYSDKDDKLYFEALYYGGRVYADMGDTPTALQYFHQALDNFPEDSPNLDMKANILSQTGRLLTSINLFDEAVPYIEEAIAIGNQLRDTLNMVYDIQLLGGTYRRAREFDRAESLFNKALSLSSNLPPSFTASSRMSLADIKYQQGKLDSALVLIRASIDSVSPMSRNNALAYASKIYLYKNILDTALIYAQELLNSSDQLNKGTAYQTLLSPKLRNLIPSDTIDKYITGYRGYLENYYDSNKMQLAVNEQNFYNYQLHERARIKAESFNTRLKKWISGISFLCFLFAVAILYYKNKVKNTLLNLHIALSNINKLKAVNHNSSTTDSNATRLDNDNLIKDIKTNNALTSKAELELRETLKNKLLSIYNDNIDTPLNSTILESDVYKKLSDLIKQRKALLYDDIIWDELEKVVIKVSPNFKYNLQLLTQSHLTTIHFHTALLIKCHFNLSQMVILLGRTKGAIVSRRDSLSLKIFGEKMGTKVIDGIIRLL